MNAQCCPVCHGKGTVPPGFYDRLGTSAIRPQCRSCAGKGYVVVPAYAPPAPQVAPVNPGITIDPNKWEMPNRITSRDIGVITVRYGA